MSKAAELDGLHAELFIAAYGVIAVLLPAFMERIKDYLEGLISREQTGFHINTFRSFGSNERSLDLHFTCSLSISDPGAKSVSKPSVDSENHI